MASIEIFPISVNGIAPPLNLLSEVFTNKLDLKNLFYPLDLAANPNYGHAVQFRAVDTTYNIENTINGVINGTENLGNIFYNIINPTNFKIQSSKSTLSTVSLYMPDSLQMNYNHDWSQISLTQTLGKASYIAAAVSDYHQASGVIGSPNSKGNVSNLYAKGAAVGAAEIAGNLGLSGGPNSDFGSLIGNVLKQVPNPQLQMLYKGTDLREFQFQFKFTPASRKEAVEVEKIIETFQYYSAPKLLGSNAHMYLQPPQLFEIDFLFIGGSGLQNAISNFFKNIGTNILTSQLYADMFGGAQQSNLNPNNNKARVFRIYNACALKDISLDYAPNGWAAHEDGAPVETTMTLTFKEVDIVTKDNIRPDGGFSSIMDISQYYNNFINNTLPNILK